MNKLSKVIKNPKIVFWKLAQMGFFKFMSDEGYLKLAYKVMMGKTLNLDNPVTYNEKLQWLKLYDRKNNYISMVDKYEVKRFVAETIGEEHVIPTLGVYNSFDEIDFDALPNRFVLKCTHDSGGISICKDKLTFDKKASKKLLMNNLKHNFYYTGRDWPYKGVKPRIIAEEYIESNSSGDLPDYKFFTFDGEAKALFIASDRQKKDVETRFDFFDMNYNHLPIKNGHQNSYNPPQKPKCFDEMKNFAEKLGKGIPQARIDFYEVNGKVFFGEITLFHYSGMVPFEPEEWDKIFGDWIKLPQKK